MVAEVLLDLQRNDLLCLLACGFVHDAVGALRDQPLDAVTALVSNVVEVSRHATVH